MYWELLNLHRDISIEIINKSIDFAVVRLTNNHAQ
jgi:hypothetical protein